MKNLHRSTKINKHITTEYVPGLKEKEKTTMARKSTVSNIETANTANTTEATTAKKTTAKKTAAKVEPEKELDWRAIGLVKEHQSAKARAMRRMDRIELHWLYWTATAFMAGLAIGVMAATWLH